MTFARGTIAAAQLLFVRSSMASTLSGDRQAQNERPNGATKHSDQTEHVHRARREPVEPKNEQLWTCRYDRADTNVMV